VLTCVAPSVRSGFLAIAGDRNRELVTVYSPTAHTDDVNVDREAAEADFGAVRDLGRPITSDVKLTTIFTRKWGGSEGWAVCGRAGRVVARIGSTGTGGEAP